MKRSVRIVCRPEVGLGFALAGLSRVEAQGSEEAGARMLELLESPEVGVILVQEDFYAALPDEVKRELGRRPLPMVVPFPGPSWAEPPEGPEAQIIEILRQAIGYRVRLR